MFSFAIVGSIAITKLKFVNKVGAKYKGMESLNLKKLRNWFLDWKIIFILLVVMT